MVGKKHAFSCGLVTGGRKDVEGEQARVVNMNILVATPGRLLQHFEETSGLDASQLMLLVLDEADRILDLGLSHEHCADASLTAVSRLQEAVGRYHRVPPRAATDATLLGHSDQVR